MRKIHKNVPQLFDAHPWTVEQTALDENRNQFEETIFCLGNGYIGVRGTFEEGFYGDPAKTTPGTVLNGVYEYGDLNHLWARPGFPTKQHFIINQPEPFQVFVYADGERVRMDPSKTTGCRRVLEMEKGLLTREYTYTTEKGIQVHLSFERFICLDEKHTAAMRMTVTADRDCRVQLDSLLNGDATNSSAHEEFGSVSTDTFFNRNHPNQEDGVTSITNTVKRSGFTISTAQMDAMEGVEPQMSAHGDWCSSRMYDFTAQAGKTYTLTKVTCYACDRDQEAPEAFVRNLVKEQFSKGYEALKASHCQAWKSFWANGGVDITGDDAILQGIRFAMFHLNQGAGRDGVTNISANCLTGLGYSGWTFWDTEIFMSPMFQYTEPEVARALLVYRYNILDKARERAHQMDDQGALFPWSSINGEECSWIFEAATAQYHINMDVYYAIHRYMQCTNDEAFMVDYGAEILFEISKCLAHRGSFVKYRNNQFCINGVCGPDEYNPIVDNNLYTNWLCRKMFYYTLDNAKMLREKHPAKYKELLAKCGVDDTEMDLWQRAADNMYLPYHKGLDVYMQDDKILYKDPLDIDNLPVEKLPLLTHLHPLNLWRYQVIKQADIVLLMYLCGEDFTPEMKKKVFELYEPMTIHDSSLSAGIHSIVATEIGQSEEAYGYMKQSARMDLDNVNRNTALGVHSACMGGTWLILTGGMAGMRLYNGEHHFNPFLPEQWENYAFNLQFDGAMVRVYVDKTGVTYSLLSGDSARLFHKEQEIQLTTDKSAVTVAF
jgi:alpha,alpha-trehalose phosphorylase